MQLEVWHTLTHTEQHERQTTCNDTIYRNVTKLTCSILCSLFSSVGMSTLVLCEVFFHFESNRILGYYIRNFESNSFCRFQK